MQSIHLYGRQLVLSEPDQLEEPDSAKPCAECLQLGGVWNHDGDQK